MQNFESRAPRIGLIHALEESVFPVHAAFRAEWPEAYAFDLLDTSLAVDRAHRGVLDAAIMDRFEALAHYAATADGFAGRAQGILFTCSAFGPAIDAVKRLLPIPVLRPNEAAFSEALALGDEIGLVVSFSPSLDSLREEMEVMAAAAGRKIRVRAVLAENALAALKAGDGARHDALIVQAALSLDAVDVLVLGQFSMARAADCVRANARPPVLTTPNCAVRALRGLLAEPSLGTTQTSQKERPNS